MSYKLCDTTLRDGEQTPGVVFSYDEKLNLALKITDFGADFIELMPAVSQSETDLVRYLCSVGLREKILAPTMLRRDHVELAADCNVDCIELFTSLSDIHLEHKLGITRSENLEKSLEMIDFAREAGLRVIFVGEDSSRADMEYITNFVNEISRYIEYFMPPDTVGCLTPFSTYDFFKTLKEETDCELFTHCHNDFGMATANTLAALKAGASVFSGTFNGLGERAGNCPIEEICAALRFAEGEELDLHYESLTELSAEVSKCSGIPIPPTKPVTGSNAFKHESGIHVDGVLKNPSNYEFYTPSSVGQKREFMVGKYSGSGIIRRIASRYGLPPENTEVFLRKIKEASQKQKRSFSEAEIMRMLQTASKYRQYTI